MSRIVFALAPRIPRTDVRVVVGSHVELTPSYWAEGVRAGASMGPAIRSEGGEGVGMIRMLRIYAFVV